MVELLRRHARLTPRYRFGKYWISPSNHDIVRMPWWMNN